jgi:hypothetical protein
LIVGVFYQPTEIEDDVQLGEERKKSKTVIGRRDKIDFPKLSLYDVDAKIQLININPL